MLLKRGIRRLQELSPALRTFAQTPSEEAMRLQACPPDAANGSIR
jgi:hypothetical protein